MEAVVPVYLYRIVYVSDSEGHSVVRELDTEPVAGDRITLDGNMVVTVVEVVPHESGDTISAEVVAEVTERG
jgi:hypothetical protein